MSGCGCGAGGGATGCGCCSGVSAETPLLVANRPGLAAVAYRVGTHGRFKESMLAALANSARPALQRLTTREDDDFSIALQEGWATVADVLTFYQERIANESFLRTARERRSILELARTIGYELAPGVAASTDLAFTIEGAPGAPGRTTVGKGTRVQSVPGPGEKPQTFETTEEIEARAAWNAIKPETTRMRVPAFGHRTIYLVGVATQLKPGDSLLVVGKERRGAVDNEQWELRRVTEVEPDAVAQRTRVVCSEPLGSRLPFVEPPEEDVKLYALRLAASLFGYNAPDWHTLPMSLRVGEKDPTGTVRAGAYSTRSADWADHPLDENATAINLDTTYRQILSGSWIVLVRPKTSSQSAYAEAYRVETVGEEVKSDYNISAKTTRLEISGENLDKFSPRSATVLAQSDELALAEAPIEEPISGDAVVLAAPVDGLEPGRRMIVTGRRARARVLPSRPAPALVSDDGKTTVNIDTHDLEHTLEVTAPPADIPGRPGFALWRLRDAEGFEGRVALADGKVVFRPSQDGDETVGETVVLERVEGTADRDRPRLVLDAPLVNVYDRATVAINANVAAATHGETVTEVLGSGDAGAPYQRFSLKQSPVTHVHAETASGGASTLELWVNGLRWTRTDTLFGRGPRERVYVERVGDDDRTTVQIGDGRTGARLPSGRENVRAIYRKGLGREGQVAAGQLSLLITRPLGVKAVTNPAPATGGADRQQLADARANAPRTVLTLDRVVSLRDYEDFARGFAGIAKALASWTWNRDARGVLLGVAGPNGDEVPDDGDLHGSLLAAIRALGDPQVPLQVKSYRRATFTVTGSLIADPARAPDEVLAAVQAALAAAFSFEARAFGQPVALSEVVAVIHRVAGVEGVDIDLLHRTDQPAARNELLGADAPRPGANADSARAAELLTLAAAPAPALSVRP